MTRDRDIERVLDRWFTEGPTEMPDHLFDVVVDRIDRVPQRRLARLQTRFVAMNRNLRIAAAAAVILAVAGIGAVTLSGKPPVGVTPSSPSPIATASPTPAPTQSRVPAALAYRWQGETRTVAAIVPPPVYSAVVLDVSTMRFDAGGTAGAGGQDALSSTAYVQGTNRIGFVLKDSVAGCTKGDIGAYQYELSPGGGYLTLTVQNDVCKARSDAISGAWVRSDCPDTQRVCLGNLEAGDHVSAAFEPLVLPADYLYNYGRFAYTVPDGWANPEEDRSVYVLAKQGAGEDQVIWIFAGVVAHSQDADCLAGGAAPGVGRTPSAIVAWLAKLPGLASTKPAAVVIGGLSGYTLDVSLAPAWNRSCPAGSTPTVTLLGDAAGPGRDFQVQGDSRMRLILLDIGDGRTLLIDVQGKDKATWDALVTEAMPIVQSFQFKH